MIFCLPQIGPFFGKSLETSKFSALDTHGNALHRLADDIAVYKELCSAEAVPADALVGVSACLSNSEEEMGK